MRKENLGLDLFPSGKDGFMTAGDTCETGLNKVVPEMLKLEGRTLRYSKWQEVTGRAG